MHCNLRGNKDTIMEKIYNVRKDRLALIGTGKTKEFDKGLISYIYCDGQRHIRNNGVDVETVISKCSIIQDKINIERVTENVVNYIEMTFDNFKGFEKEVDLVSGFMSSFSNMMFISGKVGTGKTHLCKALQLQTLESGKHSEFILSPDLNKLFLDTSSWKDNTPEKYKDKERLKSLYECDLLIIDDLGKGKDKPTEFFQTELFTLIEKRQGKTLISSNLSIMDNEKFLNSDIETKHYYLNSKFDDRIISRLLNNVIPVILKGRDYRTRKI